VQVHSRIDSFVLDKGRRKERRILGAYSVVTSIMTVRPELVEGLGAKQPVLRQAQDERRGKAI
jgi:hypothetical protein